MWQNNNQTCRSLLQGCWSNIQEYTCKTLAFFGPVNPNPTIIQKTNHHHNIVVVFAYGYFVIVLQTHCCCYFVVVIVVVLVIVVGRC